MNLITHGEAYYNDAPLSEGEIASDGHRVFQEAIASYVGHRAASWYGAYEMLSVLRQTLADHSDRAMPDEWFDNIKRRTQRSRRHTTP